MTYKINIRLWSDTVSLGDILEATGIRIEHEHRKGEETRVLVQGKKKLAERHYVSTVSCDTDLTETVSPSVSFFVDAVEQLPKLKSMLSDRRVRAEIWVSVTGGSLTPDPPVDRSILSRAHNLLVRVLVDNLTRLSTDAKVASATYLVSPIVR